MYMRAHTRERETEREQKQQTLPPRLHIQHFYEQINFQPNFMEDTYSQITNKTQHNSSEFHGFHCLLISISTSLNKILYKAHITHEKWHMFTAQNWNTAHLFSGGYGKRGLGGPCNGPWKFGGNPPGKLPLYNWKHKTKKVQHSRG